VENILAFVLSGGGSRGAMQVGALNALLKGGYKPDIITGTSIGAANAAFLAVHGYNDQGLQKMEQAWKETIYQNLLPTNFWWLIVRSFFRHPWGYSQQKIRDFAIANGITPELQFKDIRDIRLFLVASDLNSACPVIFGLDPEESVLEGVLASTALPPWVAPLEGKGRYLVDGGAVSNLPIETAIQQGATEIIALDLFNPDEIDTSAHGLWPFLWKLNQTVENRQIRLEMALAREKGILVRHISLVSEDPVSFWDFHQSVELIQSGHEIAFQSMNSWKCLNN
jgi:NTE family protein